MNRPPSHRSHPISRAAIPWVKPGHKEHSAGSDFSVFSSKDKEICRLNPPARLIWRLCNGDYSVGQITEMLGGHYAMAADQVGANIDSTLKEFQRLKLIVFTGRPRGSGAGWQDQALAVKTYHISYGNVAEGVLRDRGWKRARPDDLAGFTMLLRHRSRVRVGLIEPLEKADTVVFDNKAGFYKRLLELGQEDGMPLTFLDHQSYLESSEVKDGDLWFVKLAGGTLGKGVRCCNSRETVAEAIKDLGPKRFVIQKEVEDPFLIEGRKFVIRVFILLLGDMSVHVSSECLLKIQSQTYDRQNMNPHMHVLHTQSRRTSSDNFTFFENVYPGILETIRRTVPPLIPLANPHREPHKYQLMGADFICDMDFNTRLLEINDWPELGYNRENPRDVEELLPLRKRVFIDFYDMLFDGKPGRFERVWP